MGSYGFEDKTIDLFIKRCALDEGIEEKKIRQYQEKISQKMQKFIEEETKNIDIRYFHEINTKLREIHGTLEKDFEKLKRKHPLAFYRMTHEAKKSFQEFYNFFSHIQDFFLEDTTNLTEKISEDYHRYVFDISQGLKFLKEALKEVVDTMTRESYLRTATRVTRVLDVYTATMMVFMRLIEFEKYWDQLTAKEKDHLEGLLFHDITTLSNFSLTLPTKKAKIKAVTKPNRELLQIFFG